jgi:3-oxoacyl-[acyl-carrier-protein] synthase II
MMRRLEVKMLKGRRVVISGIGAHTPLGKNVRELGDALEGGRGSVKYVGEKYPILKTCDVQICSDFGDEYLTREVLGMNKLDFRHLTSRCTKIAIPAVREAVYDSGIFEGNDSDEIRERMGVAIGAGFGGISDIERNSEIYFRKGLKGLDKFIASKTLPGATAGQVTIDYDLHGENYSVASACASGLTNPISICKDIQLGFMDAGIAGGTGDSSMLTIGGFDRLGALSKNKRNSDEVSRAFDSERDGFVVGEGAGALVLEELEHARKRRANIYAEVLGYWSNSDGVNPFQPREDAEYLAKSMIETLKMAELNSCDVGYINAHGTSTIIGDRIEALGIRRTFGEDVNKILVSSFKDNLGHLLNGAGSVELVACLDMMKRGLVYVAKNYKTPDKDCNLNFPLETRKVDLENILKVCVGFGGKNASMILGKV